MCRLLVVKSDDEFEIASFLKKFAKISKNSKEYQGHGWGCSYLTNGEWSHYRNIKPIWEDDLNQFGKTTLLVGHARSAFEDKGIKVENNMPFFDGKYVFIFNGELRGVRIKEKGRIGAEKIFNFIKKFDKGDIADALDKAIAQILKRTRQVKGLNIIMVSKNAICLNSYYTERPNYFTMYKKINKKLFMLCSDPFEHDWKKIDNGTVRVWI